MIRPAKHPVMPAWHRGFLGMLPQIRQHALVSFRHLNPDAKEEAVQEVVCNALRAYVRLLELNKVDLAYPTVLARFGVAQVRDGRKVGCKLNVRDVSSQYAQQQKGFVVERLDQFDEEDNAWREILIEDKNATPADVAATRMDFTSWLKSLPLRIRRITKLLATGEKTTIVAKKFNVSAGRISQLRRELALSWKEFRGEAQATSSTQDSSLNPAA